jgi:Holliday junction resolvase
MSKINSRAKGATGERELSNILKKYGFNTRRGQQFCGANGDADIVGLDKIHIECKRVEKLNIDNAIEQAKADTKNSDIPCVFHRKNYKDWKVTMELEDWIKLYKEWINNVERN